MGNTVTNLLLVTLDLAVSVYKRVSASI